MPYFDENPLDKLVFQAGDAQSQLDLRGMRNEQAMQSVEALLLSPDAAGTYLIHFDAAADDGRETLFLPLGRRLLDARRSGLLARCLPASDGTSYFIAFADSAFT